MNTIFDFSPLIVAIIPVVIGLVQVVKQVGLPTKFAPLASIVLGFGLVALTSVTWPVAIVQGIIVGLAASGLWSGSKSTLTS